MVKLLKIAKMGHFWTIFRAQFKPFSHQNGIMAVPDDSELTLNHPKPLGYDFLVFLERSGLYLTSESSREPIWTLYPCQYQLFSI